MNYITGSFYIQLEKLYFVNRNLPDFAEKVMTKFVDNNARESYD
jgi:hypothetical protein